MIDDAMLLDHDGIAPHGATKTRNLCLEVVSRRGYGGAPFLILHR